MSLHLKLRDGRSEARYLECERMIIVYLKLDKAHDGSRLAVDVKDQSSSRPPIQRRSDQLLAPWEQRRIRSSVAVGSKEYSGVLQLVGLFASDLQNSVRKYLREIPWSW